MKLTAALVALAFLRCGNAAPEEPLPLGADSASCGGCHEDHYDAWATSPHGLSATSPVLTAMLPEVEAEWGVVARQTCEGCHAPAHAGEEHADEGIGCVSCHAATGNQAERDGMIDVELDVPLAGPFDDAEPTVAHGSRRGGFLPTSRMCGTCHELTGPNLVEEPTLTEHRASPQAAEGRTCASCHLPSDGERPISNDATRSRPTTSHRFVGFDPPWGADEAVAIAAAERTRALLDEALDLEVRAVDGGVEVTVTNVGAGHSVPTGAAFLRDLWIDLERDGEVIAARVIVLGDQPMQGETPVPLLTRADRVEIGSLPAGERRAVTVPVDGPIIAVLRGRAVREEVLDALDLRRLDDEIPTHVVATASVP